MTDKDSETVILSLNQVQGDRYRIRVTDLESLNLLDLKLLINIIGMKINVIKVPDD